MGRPSLVHRLTVTELLAKGICMKHHRGHKTKADGKKYYIEPVFLNQTGVEEWKFEEDLIEGIVSAPSLTSSIQVLVSQCNAIACNDIDQIQSLRYC